MDYFNALKSDTSTIEGYDYGLCKTRIEKVSKYAKDAAMPDFQAALLHRLVHFLKPSSTLELGTNLGKSLACMASAHPSGRFTGVEGNAAIAEFALKNHSKLGLDNTTVISQSFDEFFEANANTYDLVFIDGDHNREATLRYFSKLKKCINSTAVIIFHDIYWSKGMAEAWQEIKKDRDVRITLDLYFFGIAFTGLNQAKEDFKIKFPLRLSGLFL